MKFNGVMIGSEDPTTSVRSLGRCGASRGFTTTRGTEGKTG